MTQEELNALIEILNRIPMTIAERLWLNELLSKLKLQEVKDELDTS